MVFSAFRSHNSAVPSVAYFAKRVMSRRNIPSTSGVKLCSNTMFWLSRPYAALAEYHVMRSMDRKMLLQFQNARAVLTLPKGTRTSGSSYEMVSFTEQDDGDFL